MNHNLIFIKHLIFIWTILFFGWKPALSQTLSVHSTPNGIFVSVDKSIPGTIDGWKIEKQQVSAGVYEEGATLHTPIDLLELGTRLDEAILMLSFEKNNLSTENLWQKLNSENLQPDHYLINLPPVKLAMGTSWLDSKVENGKSYRYRIINNSGDIIDESEIIKYPVKIDFPKLLLFQSSAEMRNPSITWNSEKTGSIRDFEVFRTPFGKGEYEKINTSRRVGVRNDTLWLKMTDTTLTYEGVFLYFIVPKDFYGNKGSSSIAVQVSNLTKQTLPVFTKLEAESHPNRKSVILNWEISRSDRVRSLHLYRSTSYDGNYQLLSELSPTDTVYIDPVLVSNENYYYYFQMNDIYGESRKSARFFGLFKGSIIPNPPRILTAETIEDGAKISWKGIGESIRGYYILRGEGYKGELIQISPFIPASTFEMTYIDTSTTLKGDSPYGYAVVAESDTYDRGGHSDTLFVRPAVSTSITPPAELSVLWNDSKVKIIWSDHSKFETHLAGYNVWRKQSGEENFTLMTKELLPNTQNLFIDGSQLTEAHYEYAITSVDHFGSESNKSRSKSIDLKGKLFLEPEDFWAQRSDKGILLKWVIENTENLSGFNIYKSNDKDQIVLWKTLSSADYEFLDTEIREGQSKIYQISAVYKTGIESEKTKPVYMRL